MTQVWDTQIRLLNVTQAHDLRSSVVNDIAKLASRLWLKEAASKRDNRKEMAWRPPATSLHTECSLGSVVQGWVKVDSAKSRDRSIWAGAV